MKLIGAEPVLGRIARLAELLPNLCGRTLYHAGPPFVSSDALPAPLAHAAAAAIVHERWAGTHESALRLLAEGAIRMVPAQDVGLVTPLAFVVSPSMFCLEVCDANCRGSSRLAPLNDGPPPDALRFGKSGPLGLALIERLDEVVGHDLACHAPSGAPMLPLLAAGLAGGDDLHGHVASAQAAFLDLFGESVSGEARSFMLDANQFVLNAIMATAALILSSAAGVDGSDLVIAAGGNGVAFGYKTAGHPDTWITLPATRPQGARFPGKEGKDALPAIGDSAVIDALGLGAACLRLCPTLSHILDGKIDNAFFKPEAHDAFVGPHPAFEDTSVRVGLDLTRPRICLGTMLGIVEANGIDGLIGRGVATWPAS